MAYPLDACPPAVRDSNEFVDTLEANAPYKTVSDIEVEVPPVANKDMPFVKSVRTNVVLTPDNGIRPPGTSTLVGWSGAQEYAERKRMRELLKAIHDKAKYTKPATGPIHPDAVKLLGDLTVAATTRLNQIKAIYDKWKARRIPSKFGDQTPDGRQDLNLSQAVRDYVQFAAPLNAEERFQIYQALFFGQPQWLEQVGYEGNIHTMPDNVFWSVFALEQKHDRDRIRQLYREAYKMLWCAEYGVAQSQSYYTNKARYLMGPGGKQAGGGFSATPPPPVHPGLMFMPATLGGLKTTYMPGDDPDPIPPPSQGDAQIPIPVPPMDQVEPQLPPEPPQELPPDADAGEPPPMDAEPPPMDADPSVPPTSGLPVGPVTPAPVAVPWYQTAGGKAFLAAGAVALLGVGIYGGYRYLTAPRYA